MRRPAINCCAKIRCTFICQASPPEADPPPVRAGRGRCSQVVERRLRCKHIHVPAESSMQQLARYLMHTSRCTIWVQIWFAALRIKF